MSDGAAVAGAWIEVLPLGPGAGFPAKPLRIEGFPDLPALARGTGADGRFEQVTWEERSAWIACADDGRRMSLPVEVVPTAEPSGALELALRPTRTLTVTPPKARWWAEELTVRHRPTGIALWVRPYREPVPLEVRVPEGEYVLELRDRVEGRVLAREVTVAGDDLTLDLAE